MSIAAVPDPADERDTDEVIGDVERWAADLRRISDEMRREIHRREAQS